jgi:ribosomal protein S18 acetylase RimI-like enzyme
MDPGTTIEPAAIGEASTIAELWVALASDQREHGSHLAAAANRERILGSIDHHLAEGTLLVARTSESGNGNGSHDGDERAGRSGPGLVGFVMFSIERRLYAVSTVRGIVHNLYVIPDRRGEGIGSALLAAAEDELVERGAERISLEALSGNEEARRFYEENGYSPHRIEFEKRAETDNTT